MPFSILKQRPLEWGVVAMINEPAPLVYAFAAHYVNLWAKLVTIYLDIPDPALKSGLESLECVKVIECSPNYWRKFPFPRPLEATWRQKLVAQECYNGGHVDWLLHCDGDEFLVPEPKLFSLLADRNDPSDYIEIQNMERVHRSSDFECSENEVSFLSGCFRRPYYNQALMHNLHGKTAAYLGHGFTGYCGMKSFMRRGRRLIVGIHSPAIETTKTLKKSDYSPIGLAHFDGLTEKLWFEKMFRKLAQSNGWKSKHATRRLHRLMSTFKNIKSDPAALSKLYRDLKTVDERQEKVLREKGLLTDIPLSIEAVTHMSYPSHDFDFTIEHVNKNLSWKTKIKCTRRD